MPNRRAEAYPFANPTQNSTAAPAAFRQWGRFVFCGGRLPAGNQGYSFSHKLYKRAERPGTGAFLLPSQALRASSPTGGAKCTPVNREMLCGKINIFGLCLTTNFAAIDAGTLASPCGGGVPALCAGTERGAQNRPDAPIQKRMNIQNYCINNPNIHFTLPPKVTKRKQKPKNSKSGLDTGGGVCYNAFERKGPSFQPVLGLYLLYTIRRKKSL